MGEEAAEQNMEEKTRLQLCTREPFKSFLTKKRGELDHYIPDCNHKGCIWLLYFSWLNVTPTSGGTDCVHQFQALLGNNYKMKASTSFMVIAACYTWIVVDFFSSSFFFFGIPLIPKLISNYENIYGHLQST